jgi:peptidoglycan hydrolase-like protein with peptidoglycan-binding domain
MRLKGRDLRAGLTGNDVAELHDELEHLELSVPAGERKRRAFGPGTAQAVAAFQRSQGLVDNAIVDRHTAAALDRALAGEAAKAGPGEREQEEAPKGLGQKSSTPGAAELARPIGPAGRLFVDKGLPAEGVTLRFYERHFGGKASRIGEVVTGMDGGFVFEGDLAWDVDRLDVRGVGADGKEEPLVVSHVGPEGEEIAVVISADKVEDLKSEHRRLAEAVAPHLDGTTLGQAKEDGDRGDISLLHEKTGWDGRLIALAASAEKLSESTGVAQEALYGMLRVGLPDDPVQLARVSRTGIGNALRKAAEAGIVTLSETQMQEAQDAFETYAVTARRSLIAPGTLSSYGDMLAVSGLTAQQQHRFDQIFSAHTGSDDELWAEVREAGLPAEKLQLTARLGYLTLDNAPLVKSLAAEIGSLEELGNTLVDQKLYLAETWEQRLRSLAGNSRTLARQIPPAYEGDTTNARLREYSADLAAKVRRSYPTQVVSHMVGAGELAIAEASAEVAIVLDRAAAAGYSIGRTALNRFLKEHAEELFEGLDDEQVVAATSQVKTLQRLYQITRSDEGLNALLKAGFTSAHQVSEMSEQAFIERYCEKFATKLDESLTYRNGQHGISIHLKNTVLFVGGEKRE